MEKLNSIIISTFEKEYYFQMGEKNNITQKIQTFFVIYISVLGALFYMLRMIDYSSNYIVLILYYICILIGIVLILSSIYYAIKSLHGFEYTTLPSSEEINKYKKELITYKNDIKEYNKTYNTKNPIPNIEEMLYDMVIDSYSKSIDKNRETNKFRKDIFRKGLKILFISFFPFFLATSFFIIADLDASSPRKVNVSLENNSPLIKIIKSIKEW